MNKAGIVKKKVKPAETQRTQRGFEGRGGESWILSALSACSAVKIDSAIKREEGEPNDGE